MEKKAVSSGGGGSDGLPMTAWMDELVKEAKLEEAKRNPPANATTVAEFVDREDVNMSRKRAYDFLTGLAMDGKLERGLFIVDGHKTWHFWPKEEAQ